METKAEEQAVIDSVKAFSDLWNSGDAHAVAGCFTEDGTRVDAYGNVQHGQAEIEAAYAKLLEGWRGASIKMANLEVRLLGSEYAVVHGAIEIKLSDGSLIRGHSLDVMQKVDGQWRLLQTHPKILATPLES